MEGSQLVLACFFSVQQDIHLLSRIRKKKRADYRNKYGILNIITQIDSDPFVSFRMSLLLCLYVLLCIFAVLNINVNRKLTNIRVLSDLDVNMPTQT